MEQTFENFGNKWNIIIHDGNCVVGHIIENIEHILRAVY